MSVRIDHLINVTLDTQNESLSANHDFNGVTPLRVTLYVSIVETQTDGNPTTTLSIEVSPDDGQTLIDYDKLITDGGVDAPVASVAYTASAEDIISLAIEDAIDYIRITVAGSSDMDSGDFHVVNVWLVTIY